MPELLRKVLYIIHSSIDDNYVLYVNGAFKVNGTNILIWQYNGCKNQKFKFIKSEQEARVIDVSYNQGELVRGKVKKS